MASRETYLAEAKAVWDELESLLDKTRWRGPRALTADELARLDQLYRQTTIHLSQVRARLKNPALEEHVNRLVARAHSFIYVSPNPNPVRRIASFYLSGFARTIARNSRCHMASFALFFLGALTTFFAASHDYRVAYGVMPEVESRLPGTTADQLETVLRSGRTMGHDEKFAFAGMLFAHNTRVGFLAFASGILCAVPTVFLIVLNGAMLGAFTWVHYQHDIAPEMWGWILPHGITELTAIILCGGAGLMLGVAILRPGRRTRKENLVLAGKEAMRVAFGVVPMFLFAGFAESFVRQSHWGLAARLWFAAATALFWIAYFGHGYMLEKQAHRKTVADALRTRSL